MSRFKVYGPVLLVMEADGTGALVHPSDLQLPNDHLGCAIKAARAAGLSTTTEFANVGGYDVTYFVSDDEQKG